MSGFRESTQKSINISDVEYVPFVTMLEYLYSGMTPQVLQIGEASKRKDNLEQVGELLRLSDLYMLDHLKQLCELKLKSVVNHFNVEHLLQNAELYNACQLANYCRHYKRRHEFLLPAPSTKEEHASSVPMDPNPQPHRK